MFYCIKTHDKNENTMNYVIWNTNDNPRNSFMCKYIDRIIERGIEIDEIIPITSNKMRIYYIEEDHIWYYVKKTYDTRFVHKDIDEFGTFLISSIGLSKPMYDDHVSARCIDGEYIIVVAALKRFPLNNKIFEGKDSFKEGENE